MKRICQNKIVRQVYVRYIKTGFLPPFRSLAARISSLALSAILTFVFELVV